MPASLSFMQVAADGPGKKVRMWLGTDGNYTETAVLSDPEGVQQGTVAAPLRVDPTGTTPQPVTGTFWQNTQPVSGPLTDTQLRASAVPVSGTFWQVTQPVSGTVSVTNFANPLPVSGPLTDTQLRASAVPVDVTDKAGRLLGVVYGSQGQQLLQRAVSFDLQVQLRTAATEYDARQIRTLTSLDAVDVSDRAGRLVGVVYGSQGQQIKQTATNFNAQVELATGATLYDARLIRTLTSLDVVSGPTLTKGTQAASGFSVQELKDAGRVNIMWTLEFAPAAVAEALMTMTESRDGAAVTTFTSKVVTSGKRLRITSWTMTVENTLGVNPKRAKLRLKFNTAAAVTTASPLQANLVASVATAVNTVGSPASDDWPDGIEFLGDGTKQIGVTLEFPDWVTAAQTGKVYVTIFGFEY